jgi:lipopolysaccharide export LptBFGC system permease protein LptF
MKRLIKYITKEFSPPFFMGLFGFIVFVSVQLLYELSEIIVKNHVGFDKLLLLLWYNLPYFISMGIPVGVLFSIFWVVSRFTNDNELIAMQTLGVPTRKIVIPFLLFSIVLSLFTFYLYDNLVPNSNYKAKQAMAKYIYERPEATIEDNEFVDLGDDRYLFVKELDRETGILYNLLLYEVAYDNVKVFHAEKAQKYPDGWKMENGRIYKMKDNGFLELDVSFNSLDLNIAADVEEFINFSKGANEMTTRELKEKIVTFSKLGSNVSGLVVSYHNKFSNSFAPLVIAILGISLSLFLNIKSKSWSVITTFVLVVFYQGSGAWITALGKEEIVNPVLAAWLPNIFFGTIGILLFLLLDTKISYKITEPLKKFFSIGLIVFILSFGSTGFSDKVNIKADEFSILDKTITIDSTLTINYQDTIVYAGKGNIILRDDNTVKFAELSNGVKYSYKENTIEASQMTINYETDTALFLNSYTLQKYKDNEKVSVRIWSDETEKPINDDIIFSNRIKMTTCSDEITYYMSARKVTVFPKKFLIARDVVLDFFGLPVFYFPFYFQSLSEEEDEPLKLVLKYEDNQINVNIGINYEFENNSHLNFDYSIFNNLEKNTINQNSSFKYGIPFLNGDFFIFSNLSNDSLTSLGLEYDFFYDGYLKIQHLPSSNTQQIKLNIPKLETDYGTLEDIGSEFKWENRVLDFVEFYSLSTEAFQKKYKRSIISITDLDFNAKASKPSNLNTDIIDVWKNRISTTDLEGKYNLYSKSSSLSGDFNYDKTREGTETTIDQLTTKNKFNYKLDTFNYELNNLNTKSYINFTSNFDHKKDLIEKSEYYFGKTYFDLNIKPQIDFKYNIFKAGTYLNFREVFENNLTPSATNQINYGDFIGYDFDVFNNSFKNSLILEREFIYENEKINEPFLKSFDLDKLNLTTKSELSFFNTKHIFKTDTEFNVENDNNIKAEKTDFEINNSIYFLDHNTKFQITHQEEPKIELLENTDTIRIGRNKIKIKYDYYLNGEDWKEKIPEIEANYNFYFNENKINGSLLIDDEYNHYETENKFIQKDSDFFIEFDLEHFIQEKETRSSIQLENSDKSEFAKFGLKNYGDQNEFYFDTFEIQKKIICWTLNFKAYSPDNTNDPALSLLPNFKVSGFSFTFFINYIPDKNVKYSDEGFEFGLM